MTNEQIETIENIINDIPIVWIDRENKKPGRPIKPQYLDPETGKSTYKNHPLDPDYYKTYWKKLKLPMKCARCHKILSSEAAMRRHQTKRICINHDKMSEELN